MPNGGYLYFDVIGVTPSRERTLDEVKDQVEARFHDDEVAKRLLAKANDIVGKLKAGNELRPGCAGSRSHGRNGHRPSTR